MMDTGLEKALSELRESRESAGELTVAVKGVLEHLFPRVENVESYSKAEAARLLGMSGPELEEKINDGTLSAVGEHISTESVVELVLKARTS
jgi:hypothetical protein